MFEQNKAAKQIGALMGQGKRDEAEEMKRTVAALKAKSVELDAEHQSVSAELQSQIVLLPNFPAEIVPEGKTAEEIALKLDRGATYLEGSGSYSGAPRKVIMTVVKPAQIADLKEEASGLEYTNEELERKTEELGSVQSIQDIAEEELGLVDPDTVIFQPE